MKMIVFIVSENAFLLLFPTGIFHLIVSTFKTNIFYGQKCFPKVNRTKFEDKTSIFSKKLLLISLFLPHSMLSITDPRTIPVC